MADRDYKVVYKTRPIGKDDPRPRIPTAHDPFEPALANEPVPRRRTNPRDSSSTIDSSAGTETTRSKTTYQVREHEGSRSAYIDAPRSTRSEFPPEVPSAPSVGSRRSVVVDQRRDNPAPRTSDSASESRQSHDRGLIDVDVDRWRGRGRGRGREYYVDDRRRPVGEPYVIDARQGDIIDISVPSRYGDRHYEREERRSTYDEPSYSRRSEYEHGYARDPYARPIEEPRSGNFIVVDRDVDRSRSRQQYDDRVSRISTREREYDREDDWRLVDSMRDTRIGSAQPRENYDEPQSRSRAQTYSSEDSYVMVSPRERAREPSMPSVASTPRSALARGDYPEPELRRRRSRSISFRDSEASAHDASDRWHERPGNEAQISGEYLRKPVDYDERSDAYSNYQSVRSDFQPMDPNQYASTYRERTTPYEPQRDYEPRKRERSRRRRRDDDTEDGSYYSENITKKTSRETRYR